MNALAFDEPVEEAGAGGFLAQIPTILWQRRWWIVIPLALGIVASLLAIVLLPTTYRSTAVILVQSPQLPGEVIGGTTDNGIDQRIARIREQITSRPDLLSLIDQNGLYPGERSRVPLSQIIMKMRDAIELEPTVADDPNAKDNTISFALSFDYERPAEAQAVAQALMERVLNLDASQKASEAKNTVQFLTDQSNTLQAQIDQIQGQIGAISARNGRSLAGMPVITSSQGGYDLQISQLQRDNATLLSQRRSVQGGGKSPIVAAAETQLAAAKAIYADNHPDVIDAQQRLAEAKNLAQSNSAQPAVLAEIDQQIASNNTQIASLRSARSGESAQVSAAISAQARGPLAEQQIAQLQQKLTGLDAQYQAVSERLLAASAGVRAANEQMGQRLSVIDPPVIPDEPSFPNRPLVATLGVVGGLGLGLLLALMAEFIIRPIRTPEALARIDGQGPLAVIPVIEPRKLERAGGSGLGRFWPRSSRREAQGSGQP